MTDVAESSRSVIDRQGLDQLIRTLLERGYTVVGPVVRDAAINYEPLEGIQDLPDGWTEEQGPGKYRLIRGQAGTLFGYTLGAQSWKKFLHPPEVRLFEVHQNGSAFRIVPQAVPKTKYAFLGVRPCELTAIRLQDRVLIHDRYTDPVYSGRREGVFLIAVNCTRTAPTCFCDSMEAGPGAGSGFDLSLTEWEGHFLVEPGTPQGSEILELVEHRPASPKFCAQADKAVARAKKQARRVDTLRLHDVLNDSFEHPRWDVVAKRCLSCTNCTEVCPTCFCTVVEDSSTVDGVSAERWSRWDSCFAQAFSYIHGGSVRSSVRSRYRQWLTHKFASWIDQFGTSGCVGCGRCITWCPAGIDITEELRAIRESSEMPGEASKEIEHADT